MHGVVMDLKLYISPDIAKKLKDKHSLYVSEVESVWANYNGITLEDTREQHRTSPATMWFIAKSPTGRDLKIVYVPEDDIAYMRTAYDANATEIWLYKKRGGII